MMLNFKSSITILCLVLFVSFVQAQEVSDGYSWQEVKTDVDFGDGANHFSIQAASKGLGGEVQLRLDATDGPVIGRVFFHHTGGSNHFIDYECVLNQTVTGTHEVYMNFLDYAEAIDESELNIGDFQFTMVEDAPDSGDSLHVYPPVPGLNQSPYYRFEVQKLSALNAANFADATNWETPFAWFTKCVDHGNNETNNTKAYFSERIGSWSHTYCNFEMDENTPIVVKISRLDVLGAPSGDITAAAPHPARDVTSCEIINGDVYVVMDNPSQVSIDIDGQLDSRDAPRVVGYPVWNGKETPYNNELEGVHAVSVFANPFIDKPDPDGAGVKKVNPGDPLPADDGSWSTLYFMPGIHKMSVDAEGNEREWRKSDVIEVNSNRTYYIPGDAILYGNFHDMDWTAPQENIRIYGHGTLSGSKIAHFNDWSDELNAMDVDHKFLRMCEIASARNCIIEGVTVADPPEHGLYIYFGSTNHSPNYIKWVKMITWRVNNDGTVVSGNSYVEDCFIRHQDDANYIEGAGFRRCVLWSDVNGSPLRGSWIADRRDGSYPGGLPTVLNYDDIDVIYPRGGLFGKGSIISGGSKVSKTYSDGVLNTGQHLLYSNIIVEDPNPVRVLLGFNTGADEAKALKGIRFKNLNYQSVPAFNDIGDPNQYIVNTLKGNANDDIQYFVFDNVRISGEQLDWNLMNDPTVFDAQYVSDITFRLHDTIAASGNVLIRTATNGTISIDTTSGSNVVTVTATPAADYEFSGWSGDLTGTENPTTITMDGAKAITANFSLITYTVSTSPGSNGKIVLDPQLDVYQTGTEVTITAIGDLGYGFEAWGGDLSGSQNPTTITVDGDKSISASFIPGLTFDLVVDAKYGSVEMDPPGGTYNEGTVVSLIPTPDYGYTFGEWKGDLSGTNSNATIIMDEDKTVTANFFYADGGTLETAINCGGLEYTTIDSIVFAADNFNDAGSTFSNNNEISGTEDDVLYQTERFGNFSYNIPLANGSYDVTLMFAEIFFNNVDKRLFNLTIEENEVLSNFDIYAKVGKNVAYNETFSVTVTDDILNIVFTTIKDNAKVSAIKISSPYSGEMYTLTLGTLSNGTVEIGSGDATYPAGSNVLLTAIPDVGYQFSEWSGDIEGSENPTSLYMDADKNVIAIFSSVLSSIEELSTIHLENYPNPFTDKTTIAYQLEKAAHVKLTIYNSLGQQVGILVNEKLPAGNHKTNWDARDYMGKKLNSGVYICKIEISSHSVQTMKLILKR